MSARGSSDAAMVSEIANRFDVVLQAARTMLEKDKIKLFSHTPEGGDEAHAWAMLVRALNLGESATQAARAGHGEPVASKKWYIPSPVLALTLRVQRILLVMGLRSRKKLRKSSLM